jgi:hypothetical protein
VHEQEPGVASSARNPKRRSLRPRASCSLDAGQIATTAAASSAAPAASASQPPMLDPRNATGAPSGSSAAIVATSSTAPPPSAPSLSPCPRWSNATAASPAARHSRAKS